VITPDRWARLESLFRAALAVPAESRAAFSTRDGQRFLFAIPLGAQRTAPASINVVLNSPALMKR
jgi:hypothetical protein